MRAGSVSPALPLAAEFRAEIRFVSVSLLFGWWEGPGSVHVRLLFHSEWDTWWESTLYQTTAISFLDTQVLFFIFWGSQLLRTVSGTEGMSGHILDFTRRSRNSISSLIKVVGFPSIQRQEGNKRQREKEITYNVGNTRQFQVFAHRLRVP